MSPAPQKTGRFPDGRKRRLLPLLALPALAAVVIAVLVGFSGRGVPDGAVAVVDEQEISQQDFTKWLGILAKAQQEQGSKTAVKVPKPGDPAYPALRDRVMEFLINSIWIQKEAEDRDVDVSDRQIDTLYKQQKDQSFKSDAEFQKFLKTSGQTVDDIKLQIKLTLLQEKLRDRITPQDDSPKAMSERYGVDDKAIEKYYEVNKDNFKQPEQRDVRVIVNKDKEKVEAARTALGSDSSAKSWKAVAKKYSTDSATKNDGGLLPAVTKGQQEEVLDNAIFAAEKGSLGGPVKTTTGYYIFQVTKITPEKVQSLGDVRDSIEQTLVGSAQQRKFETFVNDFRARWQDKTRCRNGYRIADCDNPPTGDSTKVPGQPAVNLPRAVSPGTGSKTGPLPQGPHGAFKPEPAVPGGLGGLGGGAGGAGVPPGATGAPPGAGNPAESGAPTGP